MPTTAEAIATIEEHLHGQDQTLSRIESRVIETNGRVTTLEKEQAIREDRERRRDKWGRFKEGVIAAGVGSGIGTFVYVIFASHPLH